MLVIDPPGCGCTECLTGEYKPLEQATATEALAIAVGAAVNNTGLKFVILAEIEGGEVTRTTRVIARFPDGSDVVAGQGDADHRYAWEVTARGWELD